MMFAVRKKEPPPSWMRLFVALACATLLAACASSGVGNRGGNAQMVTGGQKLGPPDTTANTGAYSGISEYRVGAQDQLEITVFQVPDLNRTVRVNSSGQVSLPLIGMLLAGGRTVQEIEQDIAIKLEAKFLQNPQVTVSVKEFTSQRVTVEGAVKNPGIFPLTGRTTLLQMVATAGGLDSIANPQGLVIFRQVAGKKMGAVFDLKAIRNGAAEDPEVYADDVIVVDESGSRSTLRRVIEAMPVFSLFFLL